MADQQQQGQEQDEQQQEQEQDEQQEDEQRQQQKEQEQDEQQHPKLEIPTRRVKNIMKLDKDINRVNSEALFLVASTAELFLQFLAHKSARVAIEKKKRTVRIEHLRLAVKRHRPTSDFLLDSLPVPPQPSDQNPNANPRKTRLQKKPVPFATKSIEAFFHKFT